MRFSKGYGNALPGTPQRDLSFEYIINNGYGICTSKDSVFPLSTITFEGKDFPAPGNVDAYLKDLYKNYMDIPPKRSR